VALPILLVILSIVVLVYAADLTVDAGSTLARRMGVSPLLVGLTLTSVGTSLPEVATNVAAGFSGTTGADASGVALGNVLGSNLALMTLFLGLAGLPAALAVPENLVRRDGAVSIGALFLVGLLGYDGQIGRVEALLLVGLYVVYTGVLLVQGRVPPDESAEPSAEGTPSSSARDPLRLLAGLAMVLVSAHVMVQQGLVIADRLAVPEVIVGVAVGVATGFPELAVTLRAGRKEPELALGNLLGSCVANPLLALGSGALVYPITVAWSTIAFDGAFTVVASAMALALLYDRLELTRGEAVALLLMFVLYAWLRVTLVVA